MHSVVLPQYSIRLSVCDALQVPVPCSHRLEYSENNFTTDLVQREHPQNYGRIEVGDVGPGAHKSCHISEMVQDRTEVSFTD